jgi:hypothetical protein
MENFGRGSSAIDEEEEIALERVLAELGADESIEAVKALA